MGPWGLTVLDLPNASLAQSKVQPGVLRRQAAKGDVKPPTNLDSRSHAKKSCTKCVETLHSLCTETAPHGRATQNPGCQINEHKHRTEHHTEPRNNCCDVNT